MLALDTKDQIAHAAPESPHSSGSNLNHCMTKSGLQCLGRDKWITLWQPWPDRMLMSNTWYRDVR